MLAKLRFLIIDDSKPVLAVYTELLHHAGHEVTALSSCDQALELIVLRQPDCVLCDLILPGMDGLDLFKLIRNEKNIKQPTFIVISGKQFEYDRRHALEIGVDGYMTKPIKHETFVDELITLIDGAKNS